MPTAQRERSSRSTGTTVQYFTCLDEGRAKSKGLAYSVKKQSNHVKANFSFKINSSIFVLINNKQK